MMPTKTILFSTFIGVVVVGVGYFLLRTFSSDHTPITTNVSSSTPIYKSDWKTYENTAFKYRVQYSSNMSVGPLDQYNYITPITENNQIIITKDGFGPSSYNNLSYVVIKIVALNGLGAENKKFIGQDLKSFVEAKQESLLNGVDPTIKVRVGNLQKMNFASSTAYSFNLSDDFELGIPDNGYAPPGISIRYVFFENSNEEKFMIWYPKDDPVSQKIVDSFTFTN